MRNWENLEQDVAPVALVLALMFWGIVIGGVVAFIYWLF